MMRLKTILLGTALTGITLVASSNLVQAQNCPRREVVAPFKETRPIRSDRYGYRFSIPLNYRTMAFRTNGVLVFDPGTFETAECYVKNKVPSELPKGISVYATPVNSRTRSLTDWVRQGNPTIEKLETTKVANQTAVSYTSSTLGTTKSVAFFSPDRKYMITVTTPYNYEQGRPTTIFNKEVFDTVLSTFTFVRR